MRSTIGRQLNSKAERWYHGEGRRQERNMEQPRLLNS